MRDGFENTTLCGYRRKGVVCAGRGVSVHIVAAGVLLTGLLFIPTNASADWQVRCPRAHCLLSVDGLSLPLGAATTQRGRLRCAAKGDWLACLWTHTTMLHLNAGYFIHLPSRMVRPMRLGSLEMDAEGSFGTLVGGPRWEHGGVRLIVERDRRRYWIWRRKPPARRGANPQVPNLQGDER